MKHWKTTLKEKERRACKERFCELLRRSGEFPPGYIQEFDFAYKDDSEIFKYQPYLRLVTPPRGNYQVHGDSKKLSKFN